MTWANQPVGWQVENTDATMFCPSTAVAKGDVMQVTTAYSTTYNAATAPGGGMVGLTTLVEPTDNAANVVGNVWCVALEDGAAYKPVRVRLRGRVWCKVEKDSTSINANVQCVVAGAAASEVTAANCLMAAADLDASSSTVAAASRKIVAICDEDQDATVNVADYVWVNFNGVEGFGTYVGETPA